MDGKITSDKTWLAYGRGSQNHHVKQDVIWSSMILSRGTREKSRHVFKTTRVQAASNGFRTGGLQLDWKHDLYRVIGVANEMLVFNV